VRYDPNRLRPRQARTIRGYQRRWSARPAPSRSHPRRVDCNARGQPGGRGRGAGRLKNVQFDIKDVATIDGTGQWDFITAFDTIHDQAQPQKVLKAIYDSLRSGGAFLMVDIAASSNLADNLAHPLATALYAVSTLHCMTVSLAYGGPGLGTMWGTEKALEMLARAGFEKVTSHRVEGDMMNAYYVAQKQPFLPNTSPVPCAIPSTGV
jgi:SAM-dependent methyltransferase